MAGKNWFKSLAGIIVSASALLGAVLFILSHFMGWISIYDSDVLQDYKREQLDSVSDKMAREYIEFRKDGGKLPFVIEDKFNGIYNELDSTYKLIDSSNFILQQTTNIIFSHAFAPVKEVLDSHNCKYWFHVDPSGGYFWRDRIRSDGETIKTFQYRVSYNKTTRSFEYTNREGHVKAFPHKWEEDDE